MPQTDAQYCTVVCQKKYEQCIESCGSYGNYVSCQNDCQTIVTLCYAKCDK
ncbi:1306_t:CDS:1, partial [Racocetra fulgida]